MSSIVTAVFRVTIGLLVNKGRDKAAEKLKDGDVTDQNVRGLIIREIDDIKSKLDGLSRKDLLASISFFEEGIELLYEVFDKARSTSERGAVKPQAACEEAFSLAKGMKKLELTDMDASAARKLCNAKKRFEQARIEATRAFKNEALETSDRILAMQYRVMATILETVDNPEDALAPCRVCLKELNSLSAVQNSFDVQLKKGIQAVKGLFGKEKRRKIISSVCHVNRVIYDVTLAIGKDVSFWIWPAVDIEDDKVDPLRDERVCEVLCREGMEHCCVPWSFGQEGKEEQKLQDVRGIATNSSGQFVVGDRGDHDVKVFDSNGKFITRFSVPTDDLNTLNINLGATTTIRFRPKLLSVTCKATDMNDNIYVLVGDLKIGRLGPTRSHGEHFVYKVNDTGDLQHKFPLRKGYWLRVAMAVTNSDKVLALQSCPLIRNTLIDHGRDVVDMYNTHGQLECSFGEGILEGAWDIAAANDGRVLIVDRKPCVSVFSEHGDHLNKFELQGCYDFPRIALYRASEHVIIAGRKGLDHLHVEICTKDGEFVRSIQRHEEGMDNFVQGMAVSTNGHIAIKVTSRHGFNKILVL